MDLVLPELGSVTAEQALKDRVDPQVVWTVLRRAMDLPERYDYLHKINPRDIT